MNDFIKFFIKELLQLLLITLIVFTTINFVKEIDKEINNKKIADNQEIAKIEIPYKKYMGKFTATFYCDCPKCVGHKKQVRTAIGNIPYPNKTIAVDKNIIPMHSIVYIKDMGFYVAEDTGGAVKGNKIDIFVENHEKALKLGKKQVEIYLLN